MTDGARLCGDGWTSEAGAESESFGGFRIGLSRSTTIMAGSWAGKSALT